MSSDSYPPTPDTTPTRRRERTSYDRAAIHAAIDEAVVCHIGFVVDGKPFVLPQLHARVGEDLYLHGSSGARAMRAAGQGGLRVCVTITLLDALVLARSAFNHSLNYRSVVIHGLAEEVTDEADKHRALAHLVNAIVPGRAEEVRGANRKELLATSLLRVPLHEVSYKTRTGPPADDDTDLDLPYWAGILPLTNSLPGAPQPAPDLSPAIPTPAHVTDWTRPA